MRNSGLNSFKEKEFILNIKDECDVTLVGGKAFALSQIARKGFPVPEGFCITTKAYDWFIAFNTIAEVNSDAIRQGVMPPGLAELIVDACTSLKSTCAVRSSSPVEDLKSTSFAGQYTSVLTITSETVIDAVKECWASLWSERAVAYRKRAGITQRVNMAVLVQKMVPVTASGVMVTGDDTVVEAVWGLGDALVGGKVAPDRFVVHDLMIKERTIAHKHMMSQATAAGVEVTPVPDHFQDQPVLDDDHLRELCTLGKKVEAFFGCLQDIEWGIYDDTFVILQARPVTAEEPIVWSRANAAETTPGYVTYLSRVPEDRPDYITLGLTPLLACFGIKEPAESLKFTEYLYGHVYLNMSVAGSVLGQIPGLSPDVLYQSLGHTSDEEVRPLLKLSDMIKLAPGTIRVVRFFLQLPKRAKKVIPHSLELVEDIRHKNKTGKLKMLTLEELDNLVWDVYEWNSQVFQVHSVTALAAFALFGIVQKMVAKVGEAGMETRLTMGLKGMSSSQLGVEMWKLAQHASHSSAVSDVVLAGDNVLEKLTTVKEGIHFLRELNTFEEKCGDRCAEEMELSTPRWEEDPAFVLHMVAHYLRSDADPVKTIKEQKQMRLQARDTILKKMNPLERLLFAKILEKTEQYIVLRENLKTTWARGLSALRVVYLAVAEKCVEKKILEEKDDIFYLKMTEVTDIIKGNLEKKEFEDWIKERKKEKIVCEHLEVPEVVVGKPPPIKELQCTVEPKEVLEGTGCSPGVVTGKARVVATPRECSEFKEGDILVAPVTDPGWTPLFVTAKGLVMELGGTLSHGVIIAREYGVPAVVGVKNATKIIKTGQTITVDGNNGVVSIKE